MRKPVANFLQSDDASRAAYTYETLYLYPRGHRYDKIRSVISHSSAYACRSIKKFEILFLQSSELIQAFSNLLKENYKNVNKAILLNT